MPENNRKDTGMESESRKVIHTEDSNKTTMSLREMRQMLGLGKTESYYLVHKSCFETILVNGKMRIVRESFEAWYTGQLRYKMINGSPPGEALKAATLSPSELASLLGIHLQTVYDILKRDAIPTVTAIHCMRIPREAFETWYASQSRYRTQEDRERDREIEENSLTMPDAARLLGISRREIYAILNSRQGRRQFKIVVIGGRKRILKDSFEKWYAGQKTYIKVSERRKSNANASSLLDASGALDASEAPDASGRTPGAGEKSSTPMACIDFTKPAFTVKETAVILDLSVRKVYQMIRSGELDAEAYGGKYRILREDLAFFLAQKQAPASGKEEN